MRRTDSQFAPRTRPLRAMVFTLAALTPRAADAFTLNPGGGRTADDGLRIMVAPNGQMQVWRAGVAQVSSAAYEVPHTAVRDTLYLAVGTQLYGASCDGCATPLVPWTPLAQTAVEGTGTPTAPWRASTTLRAGSAGPVLTVTTSYIARDEALTQQIAVDVPAGVTQSLRLYHVVDTYLGGADTGPAYVRSYDPTPAVVGVSAPGTFIAFAAPTPKWNDWFSGSASLPFARIATTRQLGATVDTSWSTDNALAVQWNLLPQPHLDLTYRVVFSGHKPCSVDNQCGGTAPWCDTSEGLCHACVNDTHCAGATPVCDRATHTCMAPRDVDSDGDGVPDWLELAAGTDPSNGDSDGDTVFDRDEFGADLTRPRDTDGDGHLDALDTDDDNDGIPTAYESPNTAWGDTDGDDVPDWLDTDDDDDGIPTRDERPGGNNRDTDGNGVPDHLDADDDHDGVLTRIERDLDPSVNDDIDGDGMPSHRDPDADNDKLDDLTESASGPGLDSDGDGLADLMDADDDNDGVSTRIEAGAVLVPPDTDGDGAPDHRDRDSDNDCAPDGDVRELNGRTNPAIPESVADRNCPASAPLCDRRRGVCVTVLPAYASGAVDPFTAVDGGFRGPSESPPATPPAMEGGVQCGARPGATGEGGAGAVLAVLLWCARRRRGQRAAA